MQTINIHTFDITHTTALKNFKDTEFPEDTFSCVCTLLFGLNLNDVCIKDTSKKTVNIS